MPRFPPSLVRHAYNKSPLLPLVLQGARTLDSAINELRWLREHVQTLKPANAQQSRKLLFEFCKRRSRAEPLQYILGSQPFGDLDLKCRPGVLIPRPETESYTAYLAKLLNQDQLHPDLVQSSRGQTTERPLRILDLCSGSGCISLLLHSLLHPKFPHLHVWGLDKSRVAVTLARENLARNVAAGNIDPVAILDDDTHSPQVQFGRANVFRNAELSRLPQEFDLIVSNPPYVSEQQYNTSTTRSVRNFEPRRALVPTVPSDFNYALERTDTASEDAFYLRLVSLHLMYQSSVLLTEVGDAAQAARVAELMLKSGPPIQNGSRQHRVEIWRDAPEQEDGSSTVEEHDGRHIPIRGTGKIRAVALFRDRGLCRPDGNGR
ncbi:uncharacterized protein L3040_008446 [Drepanopeziza brunnea f. sp. 'multigermtubi']|uniref:uncharacterized protein n=1 Tax=Drepanopeziza brunnea f. sp. 'multigermtubi' TaxID=698441 RepID=UPI002395FF22|nr:hypothetical protein L3040_008446 [Drepanopeziza brunnea f. sp. 'multigermtubi']